MGAVDRVLGNDAENPSVALRKDNNRPIVAWQEINNIYVRNGMVLPGLT